MEPMRAAVLLLSGLAMAVSACGGGAAPAQDAGSPPAVSTPSVVDSSVSSGVTASGNSPWPAPLDGTHRDWTVRVVDRLPHDTEAFTQGLELTDVGLLESTGRRGRSTLRLLDLETGAELGRTALDPDLFGEGLTVWEGEVIQLTWEAGRALRYDATSLAPIGEHAYDGEGWGICATASEIWMSDGTPVLTRRDPTTFAPLDIVEVRRDGVLVDDLNELECIGDHVVANVWKSDEIIVIDPLTGAVVATIDATGLVAEIGAADAEAVLNGIADLGDGTLLLGGKLWPTLFVVEVVAA